MKNKLLLLIPFLFLLGSSCPPSPTEEPGNNPPKPEHTPSHIPLGPEPRGSQPVVKPLFLKQQYRLLAAGMSHVCAVLIDGHVVCWGDNQYGQAQPPVTLGPVKDIAAGAWHTCAIDAQDNVHCWGRDHLKQVSDLGQVCLEQSCKAHSIVAGQNHTCFVRKASIPFEDGSVVCFGDNLFNQTKAPADLRAQLPKVATQPKSIAAGGFHTCVVKPNEHVECWGRDDIGQSSVPADLGKVRLLGAGEKSSCAIDAKNNKTRCWGNWRGLMLHTKGEGQRVMNSVRDNEITSFALNNFDQSDDFYCALVQNQGVACGPPGIGLVPELIGHFNKVSMLAMGPGYVCGIDDNGSLSCIGNNDFHQSTPPSHMGPVNEVAVGDGFSCALFEDAHVQCWGKVPFDLALLTPSGNKIKHLVAGSQFACVITDDDVTSCQGVLHTQNKDHRYVTIPVYAQDAIPTDLGKVKALAAGAEHICVILLEAPQADHVKCWGRSVSIPSRARNSQPLRVETPTDLGPVEAISAGKDHTCVIKKDKSAKCWATGLVDDMTSPESIQPGPFTHIAAGDHFTCATNPKNETTCWGPHSYVVNDTAHFSNIRQLVAGRYVCGINDENRLICHRNGMDAQDNPPGDIGPVKQVAISISREANHAALGTRSSAEYFDGGVTHACAVKLDGTLACWGDNSLGQCSIPW